MNEYTLCMIHPLHRLPCTWCARIHTPEIKEPKMTAAQIKKLFAPGQRVRITNHYITRPDHPCFGTTERTVARVTGSHLHFTTSGNVPWPKAAQLRYTDGVVEMFGGGAGQRPDEKFLSLDLNCQP